MFHAATRERFQRRIDRLTTDSQRQWGKMSVDQMVCHLSDQLRLGLGELSARPVPGLFRFAPLRRFAVDYMPWPHGTKGPRESFTTRPVGLKSDISTLHALLERFGSRGQQRDWPEHPLFGTMSGPLWARLTCKHFDHHLRQFGV
jgi:uncharacterized protein DUF1569